MSSNPAVPCRLSVILAREAPVGVIFRRGPSRWTQVIKWNTDSDTFEHGAWFKGKIYPERCDISPDGEKLIYFAADHTNHVKDSANGFPDTWTAISKLPWLTALYVWPNNGTYYGGGLFETNTKVWVNQDIWAQGITVDGFVLPPDIEISFEKQFWDHHWHELFRLERSGWKPREAYPWGSIPKFQIQPDYTVKVEPTDPNAPLHTPSHIRTVHEKSSCRGTHTLVMTSIYTHVGENCQTFGVRDNHRHTLTPMEGVIWADWDSNGRLVYTREGKLFTGEVVYSGELHPEELADFNPGKPKRTTSPAWAREW